MNFCKQCGKELSKNTKFCGSCGTQVAATEQLLVTATTAAQEPSNSLKGSKSLPKRGSAVRIFLSLLIITILGGGGYAIYQKVKQPSPIIGSWQVVGDFYLDGENMRGQIFTFFPDGHVNAGTLASDNYNVRKDNRIVLGSGNDTVDRSFTISDNSKLTIHAFKTYFGLAQDVTFERTEHLPSPPEVADNAPLLSELILDAYRSSCQSSLKMIANAIYMYAEDHNDTLPSSGSSSLSAILSPYTKETKVPFKCPLEGADGSDYSFNGKLANIKESAITDPQNTVMVYEGENGVLDYRHKVDNKTFTNVAFADGHIKGILPSGASSLRWTP